ncbi:MAG: sensor histidine kinase [Leptospiraceae bacterium]|nr:sensor histidine kinase [Leptospiraceae bacterium]MCP5496678.1 sensor histidine kinase [Leptospiraceae bacterium]
MNKFCSQLVGFRLTSSKVFLSILFILGNSLLAIEPIILTENRGEYPLGLHLEILEDKEGTLTIDDVQKPKMEKLWFKSQWEVPNFGLSKNVYWARFKIQSQSKKDHYLEIAYPPMDKIDFYILSEGENIIHKKAGDFLPFKERDVQYRNYVFRIVPNENPKTYYLRFETESPMQFPLTLWTSVSLTEKINGEMLGFGLYYGTMLVMILYNLFLFLSVRDKSYLYYIGYIASFLCYLASVNGIGFEYLWQDYPFFNSMIPSTIAVTLFFSTLFTQSFLQTSIHAKTINKLLTTVSVSSLIIALASTKLSYSLSIRITSTIVLIFVILAIVSSATVLKAGYRPARYFLYAWIVLLFGGIIFTLMNFGILPRTFLTNYGMQFGSAFEVILLSLGLADRINELKRQNELANIKTLEAEQRSNKVKDEFLANLSHEIKTPLTIVYAYSEMLTTGKDYSDEVKEYSKEIYTHAQKLNDYVSDVMFVTDLESNLQLQRSTVDLEKLVGYVIKQHQSLVEEKDVFIELNLGEHTNFHCDEILLEKALSAIIKNAIVYNNQGGKIRIESEITLSHFQHLQITITDTGIGISLEFHEKVFEKFFRVDSSLTYTVSGVGVGLYIAKKIIELHSGSIELQSELEKGTKVKIVLPSI